MKRVVGLLMLGLVLALPAAAAVGCGEEGDTAATTSGQGADGAIVYANICSGCHGVNGSGVTGPDLTARTDLTKERIVDQVTNGGSKMPAYGGQLSSDEISAAADYVLSDIIEQ